MEMNLQFFGGRGADGGGPSLSKGSGKSIGIRNSEDIWSYRHNPNNEPFANQMISSSQDVQKDFPGLFKENLNSVNAANFTGADNVSTLGVYSASDKSVTLNKNYTNVDKMNTVYDKAVEKNYHPSRGDKTGVEAVTYHEMGHAITEHIAQQGGFKDLDTASVDIVNKAYKASNGKGGTKAWAKNISGYATENYAECVAEAVADHYCNGSKASKQSKAIWNELKKYS